MRPPCGRGRAITNELYGQCVYYLREVGDDILITVHNYRGGVGGARQVSTPAVEKKTGGGYCLKVNVRTTAEGIGGWVNNRGCLLYLYRAITAWLDIHGQLKTITRSACLGWLCRK